MPAPIVLSTLTPETKKVLNPPTGQPVIATKADLRDGSRPTSGGGGDTGTPAPPGIDLAYAGTGTPDASFNPDNAFTYLGAFYIPPITSGDNGNPALKTKLAFKPPEVDGRNGPNGSLFIGGNFNVVGEVQIPELSTSTDYQALSSANVLQDWVDVRVKAPTPDTETPSLNLVGSMQFIGDTLYISMLAGYDTNGNTTNVLICDDARNLDTGNYRGFFSRDHGDKGVLYQGPIPSEHQTKFGNATHFCGTFMGMSISSRSSYGPSFLSWSPESVTGDSGNIPATIHANYEDNSNYIERFSIGNNQVIAHYETQVGALNLRDYLDSDPTTRVSDPATLTPPDPSIVDFVGNDRTGPATAFIVPGTDTLVIIGGSAGLRYGLGYKAKSWEKGNTEGNANGYAPYSETDWNDRIWTMNINDIANAVVESDPGVIQVSTFDNNRWHVGTSKQTGPTGFLVGATFDPDTMKLYTLHQGFEETPYLDGYVVSVYQVSTGV